MKKDHPNLKYIQLIKKAGLVYKNRDEKTRKKHADIYQTEFKKWKTACAKYEKLYGKPEKRKFKVVESESESETESDSESESESEKEIKKTNSKRKSSKPKSTSMKKKPGNKKSKSKR